MVKTDFVVCLHVCHTRPGSVEIFLRDPTSNDHKGHLLTHVCGIDSPCSKPSFRDMEDDDWIKFGHALWASRKGNRQIRILNNFIKAWTRSYQSQPRLDKGGPVDVLNNPQYCCRNPVPWRPEVEARFSLPYLQPLPNPSTSIAAPATIAAPMQAESSRAASKTQDNVMDRQLTAVLSEASFQAVYDSVFPRIENGFFPGYREYLDDQAAKTRLRVVFPIIPQYIVEETAGPSCDFSDVLVDQGDLDVISAEEPDSFSLTPDQTGCGSGKARVHCNSWLTLGMEMMEHKDLWDIRFLKWETFSQAVIAQDGYIWNLILNAHLLIGGVNFANNFLETSSSLYGLSVGGMEQMWLGMNILSESVTIWPDPRDLLMTGSKVYLSLLISKVATSLGHSHPRAVTIEPTVKNVEDIVHGRSSAVLKREFSSHNYHVISVHTDNATEKFKCRMKSEEETYSASKGIFPRPLWFIQPYIASLVYLGEIRVYLVNGALFKHIVTNPAAAGPLEITEPIMFTPLNKLSLTADQRAAGTMPWLASKSLSPHQEDRDQSLTRFVLNMLYRLVLAEEIIIQRRSCMRIFTRMDIAVIQKKGSFHYTINELTRSHQTGLFFQWDSGKMDFCIQDLAKVLHYVAYKDDLERRLLSHSEFTFVGPAG